MEKIPVISMWQPWCFFVLFQWKTIETRTHNRFKKLLGQTIGIHAALKWDYNWEKLAGEFLETWQINYIKRWEKITDIGEIICTAKIKETKLLTAIDSTNSLIDCSNTQRYGLILESINKINTSILIQGKQGIWYHKIIEEK